MTLDVLAKQVERSDPARFLAVMAAPKAARPALLTLYAFNLEIARAPWASQQPMIAEMRLQWWRDAVDDAENGIVRQHEVMVLLAGLMKAGLPAVVLRRMIDARLWDVYKEPFADEAAFDHYLADTGGALCWASALALGAPKSAFEAVESYGWAQGLARFLQAVPGLEAQGRIPLLDGRQAAISALAQRGLARLQMARGLRRTIPAHARPALLAGWQSESLLRMAVAEPQRVADDSLQLSQFAQRGGLLWAALSGRV